MAEMSFSSLPTVEGIKVNEEVLTKSQNLTPLPLGEGQGVRAFSDNMGISELNQMQLIEKYTTLLERFNNI
jgi:hypothetical protein